MATKDKQEQKPADDLPVLKDEVDPSHVVMVKGDEELAVHPDAVKAHEGAGWRVK